MQSSQENEGLKRWAEIENLKAAASAYSKVNSIADLEKKIAERSAVSRDSREKLTILERRMKSMAETIKYAQQYQENRPYQIRYRKAKNPDDYFRKHETELILYDGAKEMLRRAKINPKTLDLDKLRAGFSQMEQRKKELQQTYRTAENEVKQIERELEKLGQYLNLEQPATSGQKRNNEQAR